MVDKEVVEDTEWQGLILSDTEQLQSAQDKEDIVAPEVDMMMELYNNEYNQVMRYLLRVILAH